VKHQRERHPSESGSWHRLTRMQAEKAWEAEDVLVETIPTRLTPSNQKVWLCLHCLDLPSEVSWLTFEDAEKHIQRRYVKNSLIASRS
jgi:hypothetical protein